MAYRMALIGYGFMGKRHADDIIPKIPEIELSGIYDIRQEAMDEARAKGHPLYPL
jgi:predicted dehydrogenase